MKDQGWSFSEEAALERFIGIIVEKLGPRHTKHRKAYRLAEGMPEPQRSARKSCQEAQAGWTENRVVLVLV